MPTAKIRGVNIYYEVLGDRGPWVSLLFGGRVDHSWSKPLGNLIAAAGFRVLVHDRRNCGRSDLVIDGSDAEFEIWADDLYELLGQLGALPAHVGGPSAGGRTSILFALRYPQAVKSLLLYRVTGGKHAPRLLAAAYYDQFIEAARKGGMQAVCELDHFGEQARQSPAKRAYLMSMDPQRFIGVMSHWRDCYLRGPDNPVVGATEAELRSIQVPTLIIPGNDRTHPPEVGRNVVRLIPNAELHEVMEGYNDVDRTPLEVWEQLNDRIASIFVDFLHRVEA